MKESDQIVTNSKIDESLLLSLFILTIKKVKLMYSCSYRQSNYIMLVLLSCFFFHFMCVPFLFRSSFASSCTRLSHCPRTISMTLNLNQLSGGSAVDKGATVSLPSGYLSSNTSVFFLTEGAASTMKSS